MNKRDFFLKALRGNAHHRRDWVISAFSLPLPDQDADDGWANHYYPFRIIFREGLAYFVDPDISGGLTLIDGVKMDEAVFRFSEELDLKPGELANVLSPVKGTTYGQALMNAMLFIDPFGKKIPYMSERFNGKKICRLIASKMVDNPLPGEPRKDDVIYVDEYLLFTNKITSSGAYASISVPTASPKALVVDPIVIQRRNELLEKHRHELHDPAVVAKIEAELTKLDRQTMKGDVSEGFLNVSSKSFDLIRKKLHIMAGIEVGFGDGFTAPVLVEKSLEEGWDVDKLPAMIDTVRNGSFSRGAQTALGGESVKYFHRVFQNTLVLKEDCGSNLGVEWEVTKENHLEFVGLYPKRKNGVQPEPITEEQAPSLIGKTISVRYPTVCHTAGASFCAYCVGTTLARDPRGIISETSAVGSNFMGRFMAAMHGKVLKTVVYDPMEQIS